MGANMYLECIEIEINNQKKIEDVRHVILVLKGIILSRLIAAVDSFCEIDNIGDKNSACLKIAFRHRSTCFQERN